MQVSVMLEMDPPKPSESRPLRLSVEDQVRQALELVESGYCSNVEWIMINKLYKKLCEMKPSPRVANLINMIKPVLAHYGYHEVTSNGN